MTALAIMCGGLLIQVGLIITAVVAVLTEEDEDDGETGLDA
jgi:hypothetical protein